MPTKASEYRRKSQQTILLTLPSGAEFELRRPQIKAWAFAGALPPFFTSEVRDAWSKMRGASFDLASLTPEEQVRGIKIITALIRYACVSPRIVDDPQADDEIGPGDLTNEDLEFLIKWVGEGSPGISVSANGEGMQVSDLREFHQDERGSATLPPG